MIRQLGLRYVFDRRLQVSKDSGETWDDLNMRFPALSVNVVSVGPLSAGGSIVHAGTYGGGSWDIAAG
jgi:hypothetical protein